jgi:hypothetical protein
VRGVEDEPSGWGRPVANERFRPVRQLTTGARPHRAEREQLRATVAACLHEHDVLRFFADHPAAARALADAGRITGVRVIHPDDRGTPLVTQVDRSIVEFVRQLMGLLRKQSLPATAACDFETEL